MRAVLRDLLKVFVGPRLCDSCSLLTDRVTNAQYDRWFESGGRELPCRCGGQLQALLLAAAEAVVPSPDGLEKIRARTDAAESRRWWRLLRREGR